jgi:tRNA-specific 2-thiouridylase
MIRSYEAGITPNPDVMCNEHVKFGAFYEWARSHSADLIATGHYAETRTKNGKTELHRGVDPKKDQSYFLWRIKQSTLVNVLFPIGDTIKSTVREEALRARIPTATKSDSQGICFLGHIDMYDFLRHYINLVPGPVLDEKGNTIGEHRGAHIYTNGQRHGFTITKGDSHLPHYVINRDIQKNSITVSTAQREKRPDTEIRISDENQLGNGFTLHMEAEFRYHSTPTPVTYASTHNQGGILIPNETLSELPTKGQSCVLYRGSECCGGGIIS